MPIVPLLPGSSAIDADTSCTLLDGSRVATDQRGVARPQGQACDVGAFELEQLALTAASPTVTVNEGQIATNTGQILRAGAGLALAASVGQVVNNGDGTWSWRFQPTDGPAESQTVTITASDATGSRTQTTFTLAVRNVAPTATLTRAPGPVYAGIPITLTFTNQADVSPSDLAAGFTYKYSCLTDIPPITRASGPTFTCTFAAEGHAQVAGEIRDKDGGFTTYSMDINVLPPVPTALDDTATTGEDHAITIDVLANDRDAERAALQVALVAPPSHGQAALQPDKTVVYTPSADFNGSDSFTYKVSNGLDSNVATVQITVSPVDDAPMAADDSYSTAEDSALTVAAPGLLANDQDIDSATLTAVLVSGPLSGTLALNSDGSFVYTPSANFNGSDSFTYKVGNGLDSNVATAHITVNPVDDSATIALAAGGQCAPENDPSATLSLSLADRDTSVDALTVSTASSNPALLPDSSIVIGGTGAGRTLSLSAAPRQHGQATITITVSDGHSQATLTLNLLVGTTGADSLTGTDSVDIIFGLQGSDTLAGLGGGDLLCSNDGDDTIDGGDGDDAAYGGDSDDQIAGGAGDDLLDGGKGDDALAGDAGDDTLLGWSGRDTLGGGDGDDALTGGNSDDALDGGAGDDALDGGKGNDRLAGGLGADAFYASAGRDQESDFAASQGDTHPSAAGPALRSLVERQDAEPDSGQ